MLKLTKDELKMLKNIWENKDGLYTNPKTFKELKEDYLHYRNQDYKPMIDGSSNPDQF